MKPIIRLILLVLTILALVGAAQALAERTDETAGRVEVLSSREVAAIVALGERIEAGEAVNGVKNVRIARAGATSKAASTFSLAPTPSQMVTETAFFKNGYTNSLSFFHPVLISSADENLTVAKVTSSSSRLEVIQPGSPGQPYYIRGLSKGTATLTVTASNGKVAKKTITLKDKVYISSFTFYTKDQQADTPVIAKSRQYTFTTDDAGKFFYLYAAANPSSASYGVGAVINTPKAARFTSSNSAVASVREQTTNGYVLPLVSKPGTATITVRATDGGSAKGSFKVTVKKALVTQLSLIPDFFMRPGAARTLSPTVSPSNAWDRALSWSTSNKKVARVDSSGNVIAGLPGSAVITYKNAASGLSRKVKITVGYGKTAGVNTTYRFYTFDMVGVTGVSTPQNSSMALMEATFDAAYGTSYSGRLSATSFPDVKTKLNSLSSYSMDEDDVTVIYLAGNAYFSTNAEDNGALYGSPPNGSLSVSDVRFALEKIKGTVILIVDADCSNAFITSKGTASKAATPAQQRAFASAWTGAFDARNAGLTAKGLADSVNKNKFKVLVSCSTSGITQQNSSGKYLLFTYWLARGLGATFASNDYANPYTAFTPDSAPANAGKNKDKVVTLAELYSYVKARAKTEFTPVKWQTISVWPANDPTAILNHYD